MTGECGPPSRLRSIASMGGARFSNEPTKLQTARTRNRWDRMAPKYDWMMSWNERMLFGDGRAWVCSMAHGDVLEIAIGTGRNLAFYPEDARLTGIELSPEMLGRARVAARKLGHPI